MGSWVEALPSRLSFWLSAGFAAVLAALTLFVHHGELRAVLAPAVVLCGVRAMNVQMVRRLTSRMSPVEEAWRVAYQVGYDDGLAVAVGNSPARSVADRRRGERRGTARLRPVSGDGAIT